MSNSPQDNEPQLNPNRRVWLLWLSRSGLTLGAILLVAIAAGAWWAWRFVQTDLAPLVEKNLTESLKRPVRLGKVEQFSLTGLRLGASEIPPTQTDPDRAKVPAVDVKFDPWRVLLDRTLVLNITLINPEAYIEQDRDGRWVNIQVQPPKEPGALKTEVESVRLQNGNVTLVPQPEPGHQRVAVGVTGANGTVNVRDNNQTFRFDLGGQLTSGGNFNLDGEFRPAAQQWNLQQVKAQNISAADLDHLLKLPLDLQAGRIVDANLSVKYNPTQPLSVLGSAQVQDVTAGLQRPAAPPPPGQPAAPPLAFTGATGTLLFQEQVIKLQNLGARLGQIPLVAGGGLHIQNGYDITAQIPSTAVVNIANTLNVKLPVPINGEVQSQVQVTGAIANPVLIGQFATTKPILIDKITFNSVSSRFAFAPNAGELVVSNLQAKPTVGGDVTGQGRLKLGQQGGMVFDLLVGDVPGDAIAAAYGANLPQNIRVGRVRARAQVFGQLNDLRTVARWQAPEATYAGSGEVVLGRGQTVLRDTTLRVAGGEVQVAGRIAGGQWEAIAQGTRLPISNLLALQAGEQQQEIPPAIAQGILSGRARLSGTTASFAAKDIQAVAQGNIQVAGGNIQVQEAQLNRGNWTALVSSAGLRLAEVLPREQVENLPVQPGVFAGRARLSGNLDATGVKDITAIAQGSLNLAAGTIQIQQAGLNQGNWEALVSSPGLRLAEILPREQVENLPVQPGVFAGRARLSGNLDASELKDITAIAQGNLNLAGGNVQIRQAGLLNGNWEAVVGITGVPLRNFAQIPPQFQQGQFNGQFRLGGSVEDTELASIRAVGTGNVQIAGGNLQIREVGVANNRWNALVSAAGLQLSRLLTPEQARNLPIKQGTIAGTARVAGNLDAVNLNNIEAIATGRLQTELGAVQVSQARVSQGRWQALIDAARVPLDRIAQLPNPVSAIFSGQVAAAGNVNSFEAKDIIAEARGRLNIAGGTVQIQQAQLQQGRWQAAINTAGLELNRLIALPNQLQAAFSGNVQAVGNIESFQAKDIQAVASGRLNVAGGTVQVQRAELNQGRWVAALNTANIQLNRLATLPNRLPAIFSGNVQVGGNIDSLEPKDIQAIASGQLNIAGGTVQVQQAQLNQGRWATSFNASAIQLHRIATLPNRLQAIFSGNVQAGGNIESLRPQDIQAVASGQLNTAGGEVQIQQAALSQGRWQALVPSVTGIQLSRVNNQLRGLLNGQNLQLAGNVNSFSPSAIQVAGQATFSQGIGPIDGPLNATFAWNGQQLQIAQATAPGLSANGVVAATFNAAGTPQIGNFDLNVAAQDLNLRELPLNLPNNVALAGRADFAGRASGTLTNPIVNGELQLRNLVVNNLAFESPLRGNIQTQPGGGLGLDVTGGQDRIAVQLDPNNRPETFFVQRGTAVAEGRRQGDELIANVRDLPIALLRNVAQLPRELATQQIDGTVSGTFGLNLNTFAIRGENVAIANGRFGPLQGYQISGGSFIFNNGQIEVTGGELQQGDSRYAFNGSIRQTEAGPEILGRVAIANGKIEEVLKVARLFNLLDFNQAGQTRIGRAADVPTTPINVAGQTLQNQLRRFSEIEALLQQERDKRRQESPLPQIEDLANLKGTFSGNIDIAGTPASGLRGLRASFDLQGANWILDNYKADTVALRGRIENSTLTVEPLRIQSENSLVAFNGTVGLQQQTGRLEIQNFPVAALRNFIQLPFILTGNLNATADLSGNLDNPRVTGNLALVDGTLNQTPVQSAEATFEYNNARLIFNSEVLVTGTEPITIAGNIPYQLPFASVKPDSDQLALDVNVKNEGLALLGLFTRRQIEWVSGQGQVQLQVRGTLKQPIPTGFVTVENATLRSQLLQDQALTGVTGRVDFVRDRIIIANDTAITGQFGQQGRIILQGILPLNQELASNDPEAANPLTVTLDNLALNIKGLYQGKANGSVTIEGTALNPNTPPEIGGVVELSNGQVFLAATGGGIPGGGIVGAGNVTPEFNNLLLRLGQGVQISQPPILNFQAAGDLTINGPLNGIEPEGIIRLRRGQVNLFAAQFFLARNEEHTAEFIPERGLDPILNVRLTANVQEVTRTRLPSATVASEISDEPSTAFGSLRTVRVEARVNGPASQLTENLELTSNPPRSREELVALIGGGFIQTLGQGGDSTLGLANLAGSVLLPGLQGTINSLGQTIGLSDLRIFPTAVTSQRGNDETSSTLGLAAEAGIDITRNFSASLLRILTSNQPTQFNLRYRINNEILLRGSTDFSGDTRAVIEFERRF